MSATDDSESKDFAAQADEAPPSALREILGFLATEKRWWLVPIFIAFAVLGVLIAAGSGPLAPFIYTLF